MIVTRRWKLYRTRMRLLPEFRVSLQSEMYCGGLAIYWLSFAVEYDHLSKSWMNRKHV